MSWRRGGVEEDEGGTLGRIVGEYLKATARPGGYEATLRLLRGRGVGCRRRGMELEEDETLERSTGIDYKATTRGGYCVGYTTRLRHGEATAWGGDGAAIAWRGWDGGWGRVEEEKQEVGTVGRSMGK